MKAERRAPLALSCLVALTAVLLALACCGGTKTWAP